MSLNTLFHDETQCQPLSPSKSTSSLSPPQLLWRRRSATATEIKETLNATLDEQHLNQYSLHAVLGRGSYGIVHLATDNTTQARVAIKEFSKSKLTKLKSSPLRGRGRGTRPQITTDPISLVQTEVAIFKKLNHANVVKLYEVLDNPNGDSLYMVFECCENGPILDLSRPGSYSEPESRRIFQQIILGIEYLHANGISHRDIKPDNLLFSKGTVKIVDFGVSEMFSPLNDSPSKSAGSPAFFAPELCVVNAKISSKLCDIWAIGVTLYALSYGGLPFTATSLPDLFEQIRTLEPSYPPTISESLIELIKLMLTKDPGLRITIPEIRDHSWTTDNNRTSIPSTVDNCVGLVTYVTEEEIEKSVKRVNDLFTVIKAVSKLKRLNNQSKSNLLSSNFTPNLPVHGIPGAKSESLEKDRLSKNSMLQIG